MTKGENILIFVKILRSNSNLKLKKWDPSLPRGSDPWEIDSLGHQTPGRLIHCMRNQTPEEIDSLGHQTPEEIGSLGHQTPGGIGSLGHQTPGENDSTGYQTQGSQVLGRFIYTYTLGSETLASQINNQNLKYFNTLVRGQVSLIYEKSWRLIISFDLLRRVRRRNSWDEAILWYFFQLHGFLKKNIINKFKGTVSHVVDAWDPVPTVVHEAHYPMYRSST